MTQATLEAPADAEIKPDELRAQVAELSRTKGEPDWLLAFRLASLEQALGMAWWTGQEESWRRTPRERLPRRARVGRVAGGSNGTAVTVPQHVFTPHAHAGLVHQIDGRVAASDLADQARAQGVIEPIIVRPRESGGYEIVAGERRWRAAQLAGLETIPAVVRSISDRDAMAEFGARLPFTLTDDQRAALVDVLNDLGRDTPMSRRGRGDVGSGKTAVAAGALLAVCRAGWQGAMMAPTEVLAEQHAQTLAELLEPLGVRVERISGGIPAATKRRLWRDVAAGDIGVVVGTQALIQQSARFARLNLAVVDEQHRFGVQQRGEIRAKGYNPHLLAMTATPIPRTLALTFYGDLDITSIREMPQGREPVRTAWVPQSRRADAYAFVRQQVESGGQAFVICPLIQESESLQVRSAKDEFERLTTQVYPDLAHAIGLLHGRLSAKAKDAVMRAFRDGEVKILVGTAVVEVGIDVPQATVIMIEGAERFGLSQLHQLRGRVGRGGRQSHCLLLSDTTDATENARLRILQSVHDGFKLAERDLELRGPGDILGTRQHGLTGFQFASVSDMEMIWRTREDAEAIIQVDPELERPEHARLAVAVQSMLQESEWS